MCLLWRTALTSFVLGTLVIVSIGAPNDPASFPVLQIRMSPAFLNAAQAEPIDRPERAHQCQDGFSVTTNAQVRGWSWLELVPSEREALLRLRIQGQSCSRSCMVRNRLHLQTEDHCVFHGIAPLTLTVDSIVSGPLAVGADTHVSHIDTCTTFRPLADLASRGAVAIVFPHRQQYIDRIATDFAIQSIQEKAKPEISERLARMERSTRTDLIDPLVRAGVRREEMSFSTGAAELLLTARLAGDTAGSVHAPGGREDVTLRMQESFLEELAQRKLSSRTMTGDAAGQKRQQFRPLFPNDSPPAHAGRKMGHHLCRKASTHFANPGRPARHYAARPGI